MEFINTILPIVKIIVILMLLYFFIKWIVNKCKEMKGIHSLLYTKYKYLDDQYIIFFNRLEDGRLFFFDNPIDTKIANILLKNRASYNGKYCYTVFKNEMSEENFLKALHVLENKIKKYYETKTEEYNQVATLINHEYESITKH